MWSISRRFAAAIESCSHEIKSIVLAALFVTLCSVTAEGQIFSSDLDGDGTGWTVTTNGDTDVTWQFDYSTMGIPSAPNGDGTTGVRLAANITADDPGAGSAIALSPGITASGQYQVQFDFWLNYHINGSTEEGGGAVAFDAAAGPLGGTGLLVNTDGDSGTDYKLFTPSGALGLDSGMYAIPSLDAQDPSNTAIQEAFPSQTAPEAQGTGYTNPAGTFAFAWHTMQIDVDTDAQTAAFSIDGFDMGTVTGGDYSGDVALIFTDPFGSVAGDANLAFGVFDNLTVVPEPSATLLLTFGIIGLLSFRRR